LLLNRAATRLYVADSNADSVSVIDTARNVEIERIDVHLAEGGATGASPEGLALDTEEERLLVAEAHANAVAVVELSAAARGVTKGTGKTGGADDDDEGALPRSRVIGLLPTGQYPSAVAVVGDLLVVANGKGTGFASSSMTANGSGRVPTAPNYRFPAKPPFIEGQYIVSEVAGNFSAIPLPDERRLAEYSQQVMRNDGLLGRRDIPLFPGRSPITHVIYIIRENRTYDQVFGDLPASGDGTRADGDPTLAIFGAGAAARVYGGPTQVITPNARALALRFGLLDRFFVNSEASPDGHNWCTAAFSSDYVDKAFRLIYSGRGRSYDFEGFNRLPNYEPPAHVPEGLPENVQAEDVADFMKQFVPYLHGGRDVAEPETLYLWDAAARAGLSYRNYGEFIGTVTAADAEAMKTRRRKKYPDVSPVLASFATKRSLEGHFAPTFANFDLAIPDAMTVESYTAVKEAGEGDPLVVPGRADGRFAGSSRLGEWLREFQGYARDLGEGRGDHLPALSIVWLPSDHTAGLQVGMPTPQFMVADNDYALGRLVQEVSHSPYWKNTAIFAVEDDAQAGPDHVDGHRSVALVISAYNRRGALVHAYHSTVSLIRTIELLLGIAPMNQLDAAAAPIDVFQPTPDLSPYTALLPEVAATNLLVPAPEDAASAQWEARTAAQDLDHADMADPATLNRIIWFSVRGPGSPLPRAASLPAFDVLTTGIVRRGADDGAEEMDAAKRALVARLALER
jgi:YVTN family beta-propeller protein